MKINENVINIYLISLIYFESSEKSPKSGNWLLKSVEWLTVAEKNTQTKKNQQISEVVKKLEKQELHLLYSTM